VVVGGDQERVADSDDEEDDEMVVEEGAKAFSNDWLPPKQPPKQASGCVTNLWPLCASVTALRVILVTKFLESKDCI